MKEPVIIVMCGSFHGRTMATLSATGNDKVHEGFGPLLTGFHHVPYDQVEVLRELAKQDLEIIAVMLEPIQGEGGVVVPQPEYLKSIREICTENDWLMVLDEVQTGMCRTGKWFAFQHEQVRPDVMTLAKSLGNGVPIGACLANARAAEGMSAGSHGSTFGGNPLAARTALTVIEFMTVNKIAERVASLGNTMFSEFTQALAGISGISDIRGKGLMIGIQLDRDCVELVNLALEEKLLLNVTAGNVLRLLPPLTMTDEEKDLIISKVCALLKDYLTN
jgi:acetylornithine/N-succinyldiaminopimelate aminotransferase